MIDLFRIKERGITGRESPTMKDWLLAAVMAILSRDRALGKIAEELLDTGLAAEHYFALLHEDAGQHTAEQLTQQAELDAAFAAARKKFSDYMRRKPETNRTDIIERPNAP